MSFLKSSRLPLYTALLLSFFIFNNCKRVAKKQEAPHVQILIQRFDKDMFGSQYNPKNIHQNLQKKYPNFYPDFVENILGITAIPGDSLETNKQIQKFIQDYKVFYDSVTNHFNDLSAIEQQFEEGYSNLKTHIPEYKIPQVVAFIGPIDAIFQSWYGITPDFISDSVIGISLFLHLGDNFSLAKRKIFEDLYDAYLLKKFSINTIVPNSFKNIVEDIYPDKSSDQSLISQIIEKGKKIYFVKQCLPSIPDSILFGYTQRQLQACTQFEALIWQTLLKDNTLYSKDPQNIRTFIGDSPFTNGLPRSCPGYIGLWLGYQIVDQFMSKNKDISIKKMMSINNENLFKKAAYKPKKDFKE